MNYLITNRHNVTSSVTLHKNFKDIKTSNAELNPICHLLAILGTHPILHASGIRVNLNVRSKGLDNAVSLMVA